MPSQKEPKTDLVLLHGTTVSRAMQIEADFAFRRIGANNMWVVFRSNRDLAEHFARRKAQQERDRPAVVTAVVEDLVFQALRKGGDAAYVPFDAQDDEFLRGRNQWVITPRGIEILNARWLEISYEELTAAPHAGPSG